MEKLKIHFVIPKGSNPDEVEDIMKMAFQESKEAGLSPQWIEESKSLSIPATKNFVFVLQEFKKDSEVFMKLRSTKSFRVCGPMCLRSCLAENKSIPANRSPVFTTAMRDVVVTASQVSLQEKADIKEKVGFMGGLYMSNLSEAVTHLVTNAVRSEKYEAAAEKGLPIMRVEWVETVWRESQSRNISATAPELLAEYKCPVFYNMFIACSNLSRKEKGEIKSLVTKNGGTFTMTMRMEETTLLVVDEPRGEKYKHARSWDLPCVKPSYIYESVEKGYAVPSKKHLVEPAVSCSTPTKEDDLANFTYNSDPSISVINFNVNKSHIDDTQVTNNTQLGSQQRQPLRPSGNHYTHILSALTIPEAKKAGSFVDGCKVYLSGFTGMDGEKLVRILSLGGATVFTELSESTSHVVLGEFVADDVRALAGLAQKPHVVTLEWLAASIKQRAPAAEEPYYCLETKKVAPEPPSPLSQKGMQLLKPQVDASETSMMPPPPEPSCNRKLFSEFLKENIKSPAKQQPPSPVKQQDQSVDSAETSQESLVPDLFLGKKFLIVGYDSEVTENLEECIESGGGAVVLANFKGVADYAVVPLDTPVPNITALEVVTYLWLEDCMEAKQLVDIEYYHQPFSVDSDKQPLGDCCLSISSYSGHEKTFLIRLAEALGATFQDILVKGNKIKEDGEELRASTHLVCPKPAGKKFAAAEKWGLPVVNKHWLLACARSGTWAPETNYIVGKDKTVNTSIPNQATKNPDSGFETPKPSSTTTKYDSNGTFKTPNNVPVASTSTSGQGATPCGTPSMPHPAVNSLKRKSCAMTPDDQSPFHVSTPDTPYGQAIATPTTESKKRWKRFIEDLPSKPTSPPTSPTKARRLSTPISELKRRAFAIGLETSEENVNPNYSIEDMEEEPESESNQTQKNPNPLTENGETPQPSSARCSRNRESNSQVAGAAWSTPTAKDFKATNEASSSKTRNAKTTPPEKSSTGNEEGMSKALDQLKKRLSNTPNGSSEEKRFHPNYKQLANQPSRSSSSNPVTNTILDPESQPILIGWEDPVETAEKARMLNMSSPATNKPRKFVFSGVDDKEDCIEMMLGLGETVTDGVMFDPDTTHLVVDRLVRSEKLLCCLAGGRWILHKSFVNRLALLGKYVPEEEKYEWGNPANSSRLPSPENKIEEELAQAGYRWRKKVDDTSEGAFKGMRAMLFTNANKEGSYERLIQAGGGEVLPPVRSSVKSATHCFIDLNKVANPPVPLREFVAHNVPCLLPIFLGEVLTNPSASEHDSLIPEYKKLLAKKK